MLTLTRERLRDCDVQAALPRAGIVDQRERRRIELDPLPRRIGVEDRDRAEQRLRVGVCGAR